MSVSLNTGAPPLGLISRPNIARLIRYALCDWCVIVVAWCAMGLLPTWLYAIEILIIAGRLHALGVVLHDACHMNRRQGFSMLLELLAAYPIATTLDAMRYHHLRHHRNNGMPLDPYFKLGVSHDPIKFSIACIRGLLLAPAWIVRCYFGSAAIVLPRLRNSYARVFLGDRSGLDLTHSPELLRCLRSEPRQAIFFLVVLTLGWHYPAAVIFGYLIPLIIAGVLNAHRVIAEHIHVACHDRRAETVIATTVTHDWGIIGNLIFFPRNIGYHTVHHLFPYASLDCLPALHAWHIGSGSRTNRTKDANSATTQKSELGQSEPALVESMGNPEQ